MNEILLFASKLDMAQSLLLGIVCLLVVVLGLLTKLMRRKIGVELYPLQMGLEALEKAQERMERSLRDEMVKNRGESNSQFRQARMEMTNTLNAFGDSLQKRVAQMAGLQNNQLEGFARQLLMLTQTNEEKLEKMRESVEIRLKSMQEDNTRQIDKMRETVDEKLQGTLEKRLGESFKHVSERLELVHKGLGEMQTLATGVGDLKRVLTNVKTRGSWGEVQLEGLLEQILAPDQYARNVKLTEATEDLVEFAIRLPGREDGVREAVWLPVDAKFPVEDFQRLTEAQEKGDGEGAEVAAKMLANRIRGSAKDIRDKYINPPRTTDFGIMFLPTEGLYGEVVRRRGLIETIQREYRVVIAGPTTFAALLNSLQMGFRTLAIQKRSGEVWSLLGAVKTEFGKFGDLLEGVKKKLDQASNTMEGAARRSRAIERKLKNVQELPSSDAQLLFGANELEPDSDESCEEQNSNPEPDR